MGWIAIYLLTVLKYISSKQKILTYIQLHYVWVTFQKIFLADNAKMSGLYVMGYDFSVDYDNVNVDNIFDIHKYSMKNQYKIMFR